MNNSKPEERKLKIWYHEKYEEILVGYNSRILDAQTKHDKKFQMIRDSRLSLRQILPTISENKLDGAGAIPGNNAETENRSKYSPPVVLAIKKKITEDLTSQPADFEYASNGEGGSEKASVFMDIIKRTFTQNNTNTEYVAGIEHLFDSGTLIAQPITGMLTETVSLRRKNKEGKMEDFDQELNSGRYVSFYTYDPLTTLIDPNASPHRVQDTAEWIVITIGKRSPEYIAKKYGVVIENFKEPSVDYSSPGKTYLVIDGYKKELEREGGLESLGGLMVREYYLTNGKVYTIVEDYYVVREAVNDSRIIGKIPIIVCPGILDLESPYGIPAPEELRPSVEMVATAINMVADNSAMRNKLPWVTLKGLLDREARINFESGVYNKINSIMEIDPFRLKLMPNVNINSVKMLFAKPEVQEVTEGSAFMYQEGLNNIWLITGLNPTMLSGRQEKQIRVQSVAEMINNSALRSSSQIVKNLDIYFFNPMCRAFQTMFYVYYDEFSEFNLGDGSKISREIVADKKNIRVVNGSYLPADQMGRMQRAAFLDGRLQRNPYSIDPNRVEKYIFDSMGFRLDDFLRNPTDMFDQQQIVAIMQMIQELGPEGFARAMAQKNEQMSQQGEEQGGGEPQ